MNVSDNNTKHVENFFFKPFNEAEKRRLTTHL